MSGALAAWAWLALRLFALLRVQAVWRAATGGAWTAISAALAVLLAASWTPGREGTVAWEDWLVGAAFEALLGTVLGLLVGLPGEAAVGAAQQSGRELGLVHPRAFAMLHLAGAAALLDGLALHRPLLVALRGLSERWPVGDPSRWDLALDPGALAAAAHAASFLALALATPVLLTRALVEVALGLVARVGALQATASALRPWLAGAAALIALGAAWASAPEAWLQAAPGLPPR